MISEEDIAKTFHLTGDAWQQHANPWSVWTRFATLPFLVLAIWSYAWIGWYNIIPVVILIFWLIINPTLFKKPKHFNSWAAKAVLGEKFWVERKKNPIPSHHNQLILILTALQTLGSIILLIGIWNKDIFPTVLGMIIVYFAKMWFLDRMVWIYEDMIKEK